MSEVRHPTYGKGVPLRSVRGGRYWLVHFEGRKVAWQVRASELEWPRKKKPKARPKKEIERSNQELGPTLQLLEALRLGVVPPGGAELYTVGRDLELSMLRSDLDKAEGGGAARVILGDYGTGKTHLLEVLEHLALERNFAVARVVLDEDEVAPSQPRRVYRELTRNLRLPDQDERGLEPLFSRALPELGTEFWDPEHPLYHRYLSPALAYYRELSEEQSHERAALLDYIGGHASLNNQDLEKLLRKATGLRKQRLFALMDYRPWAHLYAYLLGGLAYLVRQAGYRGLAVLFDEAEFYALLNRAGREFADLLFGYYVCAAVGEENCKFSLEEAKRGGHAVHRSFPPLYQPEQHLYCVFAMTDDPKGLGALEKILGPDQFACLSPLRLEDYQVLCSRVLELYQQAYPELEVGAAVENPMGEVVYQGVQTQALENPRQVLKFVMELLDFSRLRQDRIPAYVKEVLSYLRY